MTQRPILVTLAACSLLFAGCMFSKKSSAPKEKSPAAETEQLLMQRSVEKRTAELVAQGVAADAARAQATTEFKERYGYTSAAQK